MASRSIRWFQNAAQGVEVTDIAHPMTSCEKCRLPKVQAVISRRSGHEDLAAEPFGRVAYELIDNIVAYNDEKWTSHFVCCHTGMEFVWTHSKKA
jgi:hypothetical protein